MEVARSLFDAFGNDAEHTLVSVVPDAVEWHPASTGTLGGIYTASRSDAALSHDESAFCQAGNQPCIG